MSGCGSGGIEDAGPNPRRNRAPAPIHGSQAQIRFCDRDVLVTDCGRICMYRKKINIFTVMAGQSSTSRRSVTAFGSSASCAMISDISIWSRGLCKPSRTRSAQGCHPCLRDVLLPMSPVWAGRSPERCGGLGCPTIKSPLLAQATPSSLAVSPTYRQWHAAIPWQFSSKQQSAKTRHSR
ncbi:hypothetical protein ACVIOG_002424 [Rhizobium leguminosarum]